MGLLHSTVLCGLLLSLTATDVDARSPAPRLAELKQWKGKYPFDRVGGHDFWATPGLRETLTAVLGSAEYKTLMKFSNSGPSGPIGVLDEFVFTGVCLRHDCHDERFDLVVDVDRAKVYVCRATTDLARRSNVRWISKSKRVEVTGECDGPGAVDEAGLRRYLEKIPAELKDAR